MATKQDTMKVLSDATMQRITSSRKNWMDYLDTTAWLYKYPFYDQLMIYAQRPDARACAPIELWNSVFKRWVKRGSKGIALIDDSGDRLKLRYVFDVSDTSTRSNIPFKLWVVEPEHQAQILEELTNRFGAIDSTGDFVEQLREVALNVAMDNVGDYADVMPLIADGSGLVGMDHREILDRFITTVAESVIYTVLARAGLHPRALEPSFAFESIAYFDTPLIASQLGCATRDISEMVLRQIERSVRAIERQARDNIASSAQERENDVENHSIQSERSETDGTDLSAERGLPAPESIAGEPTERTAGQIRADAEGISQDEPQGGIQHPITLWELDGTPDDDRSASARTDRRDHPPTGNRRGRERADEGGKSAPVDGTDEQPPDDGRGDGAAGDTLHLISEAEQLSLLETEADRETASFLLQQDIDAELLSGSGFENGKSRIHAFYQTNPDAKAAIAFLKDEYGIGGHSFTYQDGSPGFVDHDGKGLSFRQWGTNKQKTLSWSQVHRRIAELIRVNRYRTEEEPEPLPTLVEPAPVEPIQADQNFRITDDALGAGGPKAKFAMNVAAIRTLKQIEAEHRPATLSEQEILSRYVGWGGVADAFDATKDAWQKEFAELQTLLTDEEYRSARESVLNAHYTSPTVIKAMYEALARMEFSAGNVLEPACGIGNFFGLVPENMTNSRFYGVELDCITGRIAQLLYPENQICIQGFETADYPDHFFDVAIGNVPFGDYGIADQRYDKHHFLIHDYFFAKALDKVRPGGVVAFVTSSGTMDKKNPQVRKYLAQRAELIGAVRLPNNAFLANAGTSVVADILFLQKRDRPIEIEPDWVHLGQSPERFAINQYFVDHPGHILGELTSESTQYGKQQCTVKPIEGVSLAEQLHAALSSLHAEIDEVVQPDDLEEAPIAFIPTSPDVRNFSFTLVNDALYYRENSRMSPVEVSITAEHRIRGMIELRDCTRRLIELQLNGSSEAEIVTEQTRLNELYDAFTVKYGLINSRSNDMAFSDDSSYCLLCSLEILDEEGNLARKADMFTKRTIRQQVAITHADTKRVLINQI